MTKHPWRKGLSRRRKPLPPVAFDPDEVVGLGTGDMRARILEQERERRQEQAEQRERYHAHAMTLDQGKRETTRYHKPAPAAEFEPRYKRPALARYIKARAEARLEELGLSPWGEWSPWEWVEVNGLRYQARVRSRKV